MAHQQTFPIKLAINHQQSIKHQQLIKHQQRASYQVAVPFPQAMLFSLEQLCLTSRADLSQEPTKKDAMCQVTALWPDNSVKWLQLNYMCNGQEQIELHISEPQTSNKNSHLFDSLSQPAITDSFLHKGRKTSLKLDLNNNQITLLDINDDIVFSIRADDIKLTELNQQRLESSFTQATMQRLSNLKSASSDGTSLTIDGKFIDSQITYQIILEWFEPFDLIKCDLQIHNTNRAMHKGGKWDLGDPGSFIFESLYLSLHTTQQTGSKLHTLIDVQNQQSYTGEKFTCQQHASGGKNWLSPVHVNPDNKVELNKNGFELEADKQIHSGLRCQPVVSLNNNLSITLNQFWQNFPKSLSIENNIVTFGLFPATHYQHELQGGEKKSHSIWLSLNSEKNDLLNSQSVNIGFIDWEWTEHCQLYPFIAKQTAQSGSIQSLVELGLDETNGFIAKREKVDEYGWRHFGELYADHETAGFKGDELFVSHYNNQYDPIYGFLRQFLTTGNHQWFELANDLATHVKNIDIYHTQLDKNEYNGGLFWHTDHYLQAFTSSHRSYSKHQSSNAYQDHAGGGGPGGQHCYTTGLYLHYCMTGQQSSKQAVLTLANWITHVYEGSGTILELLLAFKNRHLAGYKNHFTGQYPLDRGIANYINALLDSFELTQQQSYLSQVEDILANTMHPNEDVSERDLQNVENTWFYTVLLQALCRYLQVKQSRQAFDQHFYYGRDCLLNFADWMLEHEYPYLQKPEILEYPNDTWTAQDLRKAHVLAAAYYFSPDNKTEYMHKAEFFQQYVADKLNLSDTKTYTRILVLLMQNQGTVEYFQTSQAPISFAARQQWSAARYQQTSTYGGLLKVFTKRLIKLSPKAELDWLKKRLA